MSPSPTPGKAWAVAITLRRPAAVACRAAARVLRSRLTPKPTFAVSFGTFTVAFAVTATVRPVAAPVAAGRRAQIKSAAATRVAAAPNFPRPGRAMPRPYPAAVVLTGVVPGATA